MFKFFLLFSFQFHCDIIGSTLQLSSCIMFANCPLSKARHMVMADTRFLLVGGAAILHCMQANMHTEMGRICDHFCILPHCSFSSFPSP